VCAFGYNRGTIAYFSIGGLEEFIKKGSERIKWKILVASLSRVSFVESNIS
jgi:hypothetical protein